MIGASDPEPALGELGNLVHEIEGADVGTIEADMARNRRSSNLQLEEGPPMASASSPRPVSALRARMIEVMTVRGFTEETHSNCIRELHSRGAGVRGLHPPGARYGDAEDLRRFQLNQTQSGMQPPSIDSSVSALRFFFTVTFDRSDLARRLTVMRQPCRLLFRG